MKCCNGDCNQGRECPVRDEEDPLWLTAGVTIVCVLAWIGALSIAMFLWGVLK